MSTIAPLVLPHLAGPGRSLPRFLSLWLLVLAGAGASCSSGSSSGAMPDLGPSNALVAQRPYEFLAGSAYDLGKPAPLVILLHGYGASGILQDAYFGFSVFAGDKNLLFAYPDGTIDKTGKRFWNATDACCDIYNTGVDDVAYINAIISDVSAKYNVDPKRIFLVGHSNGGFMSHRMACDAAGRIAAIVSLAGDNWKDLSRCRPSEPVAVLQVHGDMDEAVPYLGSAVEPKAQESVAGWAMLNGCSPSPDTTAPPLDLDSRLPGAETTVERWLDCRGGAAELWTIHGGTHVPNLRPTWSETIYSFMAAHPKP